MSDPLPLLDLTYRADLGILVGRWDHQPDPGGLPADEQLATGTRAANSRFWLQDIRRRTLTTRPLPRGCWPCIFPTCPAALGRGCAWPISPAPTCTKQYGRPPALSVPTKTGRLRWLLLAMKEQP